MPARNYCLDKQGHLQRQAIGISAPADIDGALKEQGSSSPRRFEGARLPEQSSSSPRLSEEQSSSSFEVARPRARLKFSKAL